MKRLFIVVIALLMAVTLAACSGGAPQPGKAGEQTKQAEQPSEASAASEAPAAAAVIEPEQLISKTEAAGFVGDVKDGEKKEQPAVGQKICFYETTDGNGYLQISLTQQAFMKTDSNTPESIYKSLKDAIADKDQQTAEGVGDEYFFGTLGLHILYKGYYINIAAGNSDKAAVISIVKQAGAQAVSNLDAILAK